MVSQQLAKEGEVEQDRYDLTYRAAEAGRVMGWFRAGESGCLVGLRGAGKSNFVQFLLRPDIQKQYLDDARYAFVLVNLLSLGQLSEWAVCELILRSLARQVDPSRVGGQVAAQVTALHQEAARAEEPLAAQRAFEQGVAVLCQQGRRLVFLLDEFSAVFQTLDLALFHGLRAVRDAHKGQVSYLAVITDELARLRPDLPLGDHFGRLLGRNVCGLGPYNEVDARQMIGYLAGRRSIPLDEHDVMRLVEWSGGHAGLLKALLSQVWAAPPAGDMWSRLREAPAVQAECQKIWISLPSEQQAALAALAGGRPSEAGLLAPLWLKGLIREDADRPRFFSPLFADFIHQQTQAARRTIVCRSPRQVQVGGRTIEDLGDLEFEALWYLYEHRGQICEKDDLIAHVYHQRYERVKEGVSDEMMQTLISRLRAKIEPDPRHPRYLVTIRGEGYQFVDDPDPLDF